MRSTQVASQVRLWQTARFSTGQREPRLVLQEEPSLDCRAAVQEWLEVLSPAL